MIRMPGTKARQIEEFWFDILYYRTDATARGTADHLGLTVQSKHDMFVRDIELLFGSDGKL